MAAIPPVGDDGPVGYSLSLVCHRLGGLLLDLAHHPTDGLPREVEKEVTEDLLTIAAIVSRVSSRLRGHHPG